MTDLEKNIKIVKDAFSAYSRGDIEGVAGFLDKDIDWQSPVTETTVNEISWSRPRQGIEDVKAFFGLVAGKLHVDEMTYSAVTAQGDRVIIEGTARGSVIPTGCFFKHDWVMVCTVKEGKIARFRHYYDSADIAAAFQSGGEACTAIHKAA